MSLARLDAAFSAHKHHVSPFLVLGDPTPDLSVELAVAAIEHGASMLELGFPYSDPCADGPAVQAACARAFAAGVSTSVALNVLARIHERCPTVPMNLLVYGNLVHSRGATRFCADAARAGASSLLVPDVPLGEDDELVAACDGHGLGHVQLIAPTTPTERLTLIDTAATGFLYLAAYQGVTGKADGTASHATLVGRVATTAKHPVCLGFGLSRPEDLESAFSAGARLCVVGSHLCRAIESAWVNGDANSAPCDAEVARQVQDAFLRAWRPLARARGALHS